MTGTGNFAPASVPALQSDLQRVGYLADRGLGTAALIALRLGRPLLLEGEVGVGKTELAKCLAALTGRELIRLQCYEGIDTHQALYEWDYARQMLHVRALSEHALADVETVGSLYAEEFLLERPLLRAVRAGGSAVLLIDEIDRADEEFEAFLLEILSDFQITVPELGTITATSRPIVVLTANGTRDLSDALRRRCIYSFVPYPDRETELSILAKRGPELSPQLARQIVGFVQALRKEDLEKKPGIAETLDWAAALAGLGLKDLTDDPVALQASLVALLKTEADQATIPGPVAQRLAGAAG